MRVQIVADVERCVCGIEGKSGGLIPQPRYCCNHSCFILADFEIDLAAHFNGCSKFWSNVILHMMRCFVLNINKSPNSSL